MHTSASAVISFSAPQRDQKSIEAEKASLSKEELESVTRDVQGKGQALHETPELVEQSLTDLHNELAESPSESAYHQATEKCPEYANSTELSLMMLRAKEFNVKNAAQNMVKYWESRLSLFGEQVAFEPRPIRLSDLSDEDLATFHSGGMHVLPNKDRAGRAIFLVRRQDFRYENPNSIGRLMWYLLHTALEDAEVQRNGIVLIALSFGTFDIFKHYDRKLDKLVTKLATEVLPLRPASVHYGFDSPILEVIAPFQLFFISREFRLRYTQHSGRQGRENLVAKLGKCGIAAEILPTSVGGTLQFHLEAWLEARRSKELEAD